MLLSRYEMKLCFASMAGSKKIFLHKLNEVVKETQSEQKACTWQLKVVCLLQLLVCLFFSASYSGENNEILGCLASKALIVV